MQGEIEANIEKLGNFEKLKFPFWVEGTFGDDIWWGGGRRSRLGWGQEGQWLEARWDRELGPGLPDGRGQEGQMAVDWGGGVGGWWGRRANGRSGWAGG